jgi:hypothetical protein
MSGPPNLIFGADTVRPFKAPVIELPAGGDVQNNVPLPLVESTFPAVPLSGGKVHVTFVVGVADGLIV